MKNYDVIANLRAKLERAKAALRKVPLVHTEDCHVRQLIIGDKDADCICWVKFCKEILKELGDE